MGVRRPTICLSMIVKNESAVIRRCLESVRPLITHWAISDTGSTDGTQDIIRATLSGIPGEVVEREWRGFTPNRNEALALARASGAEYLLVIDADEEFTADAGFTLEGLSADTYSAVFRIADTNARWPRTLLIKASAEIEYAGDMDETVQNTGFDNRLLENCLVVSYPEGFRSRDGLKAKFERDVLVLEQSIARDPNNARSWFYLGQRLGGCERYSESIAAYRKRLEFEGGNPDERYQARFQIAQNREHLGDDWREVAAEYLGAFHENPARAEPLFYLGLLHANHAEWPAAELYIRAAARTPRPADSQLVQDDIYAWLANDTLAGILSERGKLREARELLTKLVELPQCPVDQRDRIRENIASLREAEGLNAAEVSARLGPDEATYTAQAATVRAYGLRGFRDMARQFISRPALATTPSPLRWLWLLATGWLGWTLPAIAAALCPLLLCWVAPAHPLVALVAFTAPLLWLLHAKRLQDTVVAALTLAALGGALTGHPIVMGLALLALLGCKEAAVYTLPALVVAWAVSGSPWVPFALALGGALSVWVGVTLAIFGRMALPVLRTAASGHSTPYTLSQQRGAPHRLFVDLALVSPVAVALAVFGAKQSPGLMLVALALIAAHALAPVRNVRLVIAADLLVRAAGVATLITFPLPIALALAALWLAADAYVIRKLRNVYDPTTEALAGELGMTRLAST
jgi:glycosyltransferase involved in cell wall biosynthesis